MKHLLSIYIFLCIYCISCSHFTTFYEADFDGQKFILQEKESKGFSTNSFEWRFKLGHHPYVIINALTTDWGPPYSTGIYGTAAFEFITNEDTAYSNNLKVDTTTHTFIYLNPKKISEEEYENYFHFMKKYWNKISKPYTGKSLREFPHIIGIVYGTPDEFTHKFKGTLKEMGNGEMKNYTLAIRPDGRVMLIEGQTYSEDYSGLSPQVQMPEMLLHFKKGNYSIEDLRTLKDQNGNDLTTYFTIVQD